MPVGSPGVTRHDPCRACWIGARRPVELSHIAGNMRTVCAYWSESTRHGWTLGVPEPLDQRISRFSRRPDADRARSLPGTRQTRPVAQRHGDRLLRFARLAGGDLRYPPGRTVRGAQYREPGARL